MRRLAGALVIAGIGWSCSADSGSDDASTGGASGSFGSGGQASSGSGGSGGAPWGGASGSAGSGGAGGGPSCGELAQENGWAQAACEWNGNDACGGLGTPTYDCEFCCEVGGSGGSSGAGGSGGGTNGFGYPVGDKSTSPAGGWVVWQVLSHYWDAYGGRHLAQDISVS
jgi:hypothetical protein